MYLLWANKNPGHAGKNEMKDAENGQAQHSETFTQHINHSILKNHEKPLPSGIGYDLTEHSTAPSTTTILRDV
jgi:hypothetical protein